MLCRITMSSQVLTHGEQLAGLASRAITEALGTEPEGDDDARAVVSVLSDIYVSLLGHTHLQRGLPHERSKSQASQGSLKTKPPTQPKLKIRAAVRSQGGDPSSQVLISAPNAEFFVLHDTWAKNFLPTLMHLFFVSEDPFQGFAKDKPPFIAIVQRAFDATHPHVSFTVTAGDDIVTAVSPTRLLVPHD